MTGAKFNGHVQTCTMASTRNAEGVHQLILQLVPFLFHYFNEIMALG